MRVKCADIRIFRADLRLLQWLDNLAVAIRRSNAHRRERGIIIQIHVMSTQQICIFRNQLFKCLYGSDFGAFFHSKDATSFYCVGGLPFISVSTI